MEKIYLRNDKNLKLVDVISIFPVLCIAVKENTEKKLTKTLIDTYTNNTFNNSPELALEVANKLKSQGIEVDVEYITNELVKIGIITLKIIEKLPFNYKEKEEKINNLLENSYIFDNVFEYLELNIKKIIISELLKRLFPIIKKKMYYFNTKFKIKVTNEKLEEVFNGSVRNEKSFFIQEFNLWAIHNRIMQYISIEEYEEYILINFDILSSIT